ncbi:MAG: hypothetical protein ACREQA_20715 [Candidatus Binatia bacterium]
MTESMKPGHVVTIYEDPFTCQVPEGRAILVKHLYGGTMGATLWRVRFMGESDEYERWIKTEKT